MVDQNVGSISVDLKAIKRGFSASIRTATTDLKKLNTEIADLGKVSAGVTAVMAGAGFGIFKAAKAAGSFSQGIAVAGKISGATAKELKVLEQAAIDAGLATQFSPGEAAKGLQALAAAGQNAEKASKTLIPALDLATGSLGQLGVEGAASAVVGTLNAYQLEASQATKVTDKLLKITQLTNFQARDFEAGLAKAAATGATFGQSMDDVLVTMGLMRDRNIDASSAATGFREAVRRLASEQSVQSEVASRGVQIFDRQTGQMRSVIDIIRDFSEATKNLTEEQRNLTVAETFGVRGLLAFQAVASTTDEKLNRLRKTIKQSEGASAGFAKAIQSNFAGQLTLLSGAFETLIVTVGKPFSEVLAPVLVQVREGIENVIKTVQGMPAEFKRSIAGISVVVTGLVGTLALVTAGLVGIGLAVPVLKNAVVALRAMAFAAKAVFVAFTPVAIPVLAVGAAVFGVVAAIGALKEALDADLFDDIFMFKERFDNLNKVIESVTEGLVSLLDKLDELTKAEVPAEEEPILLDTSEIGNVLFKSAPRGRGTGFQAPTGDPTIINPPQDPTEEIIDKVAEGTGTVLGDLLDSFKTGVGVIFDGFGIPLEGITVRLDETLNALMASISGLFPALGGDGAAEKKEDATKIEAASVEVTSTEPPKPMFDFTHIDKLNGTFAALAELVGITSEQISATLTSAAGKLHTTFAQQVPRIASAIESAQEGFKSGGIFGAIIAVFIDLLMSTQGFANIMDRANERLDDLIEELEPLLEAVDLLDQALQPISDVLHFVVGLLSDIIGGILTRILSVFGIRAQKTSDAMEEVEEATIKLAATIRDEILGLSETGLGELSGQDLLDLLASGTLSGDALETLEEEIRSRFEDASEAITRATIVAAASGNNLGSAFAVGALADELDFNELSNAMGMLTDGVGDLNEAIDETTGILNAPEGFKVNLARFRATVGEISLPPAATSINTPGIEAANMGGQQTDNSQQNTTNIDTVIINGVHGTTDVSGLAQQIQDEAQWVSNTEEGRTSRTRFAGMIPGLHG